MPELLNDEKTFDSTITKIAVIFQNEFHPTLPPFITLVNHKTQCFHYYGKQYYEKLILDQVEMKERIPEVIKEVFDIISKSEPSIKAWYNEYLAKRTWNCLSNNPTSTTDDDYIDCFLDLLLNTPISLSYGIVGQAYNTRLPRFFYTGDMFVKYSGVKKFLEKDRILGRDRDPFHEIINTLEEIFWKGFDVKSTIYAPISLYGQITGVAFVSDTGKKPFDYDKYLRFLQLTKELSITLIKDAKEYEFLSAVLKELPSKFNVIESLFKHLPIIFNITGACLQYEDEEKASCLVFNKQEMDCFSQWRVNPCVSCNQLESINKMDVIHSESLCSKSNGGLLQPKCALKLSRKIEGRSFNLLLYYDIESLSNDYAGLINLELDDALKLLILEKENEEKTRKIKHQSHLLSNFPHITLRFVVDILGDKIEDKEKIYIINYIKQRGFYLMTIGNENVSYGEDIAINICEEIDNFKTYNLLRKSEESLWANVKWCNLFTTDCDSCKYKDTSIKIVCPTYGEGALYTVFENIMHNAISKGKIIEENDEYSRLVKEEFKVNIKCEINTAFTLKIGDTISKFNKEDGGKYFKENPLVVENNNKVRGLGVYSIYQAGTFLSKGVKPELVFKENDKCIAECTYTYIFDLQLKV